MPRLRHPPGGVPTLDQQLAPFILRGLRHAGNGGFGQRAQRIAVEVDHPLGQFEQVFFGQARGHGGLLWAVLRLARMIAFRLGEKRQSASQQRNQEKQQPVRDLHRLNPATLVSFQVQIGALG